MKTTPAFITNVVNTAAKEDIVMPWALIQESLEACGELKSEQKIERLAQQAEISTTAIKIRLGKI